MSEAVIGGSLAGYAAPVFSISILAPAFLAGAKGCKSRDDLFFPDDYGLRHYRQIEEARSICNACPVKDDCLAWALPQADLDGIWAATTPPERRRMRKRKLT